MPFSSEQLPQKRSSQEIAPQTGHGSIHPDLEEGIRNILHKDIPEAAANGYSAVGLNASEIKFKNTLKAADAGISYEGRKVVSETIKSELEKNISLGLKGAIKELVRRTKDGWKLEQINLVYKEINNLCILAKQSGIDILFIPEAKSQGSGQEIVAPLRSQEEILAYAHDQADQALLLWLPGKLHSFQYEVESGALTSDSFDKEVEEWLQAMGNSGYKVIEGPASQEITINTATQSVVTQGLLRREVNKADIKEFKESLINSGLGKGIMCNIETIRFIIANGSGNSIQTYLDKISFYVKEAEARGLVDRESKDILSKEGKINPDLIEPEIQRVVRDSLQKGIQKIMDDSAKYIQTANLNLFDFNDSILENFIQMAVKYGVDIKAPELLRERKKAIITAENIQAGVRSLYDRAIQYARSGNIQLVKFVGSETKDLKTLAHQYKLSDSVDFSRLDKYLDDIGVARLELH